METETTIDTPDSRIAAWHAYWQRNREVIAGTRVVTELTSAERYLTREEGMSDKAFANYVKRVSFTPAASHTHDHLVGLMVRTPGDVNCPDNLKDVLETITAQGFTVHDLAEGLHSERLITNFTGLVCDYPVAPPGMSLAKAVDQGFRPFIAMYKAESILEIQTGTVGNRQRVTRVRLLEDGGKTVRELRLDDGVYSIVMHRSNGGHWTQDDPIIPTRGGATMDEIPFTLDSSSRDFLPVNAPLGDLCDLNIQHYVASANLATEEYYSCVRIFISKGIKNEVAKSLPAFSGARWNSEALPKDTEFAILSATDNVITELRQTCNDIERKMGQAGLRMLSLDQASNVTAETTRIRENAQTATVAGIVRRGDGSLNDQLKWVSYWMQLPEDSITYESSTDFGSVQLTSQDIQVRMSLWESGAISLETLLTMLNSELPENFDAKEDREKVREEIADRPTTEI